MKNNDTDQIISKLMENFSGENDQFTKYCLRFAEFTESGYNSIFYGCKLFELQQFMDSAAKINIGAFKIKNIQLFKEQIDSQYRACMDRFIDHYSFLKSLKESHELSIECILWDMEDAGDEDMDEKSEIAKYLGVAVGLANTITGLQIEMYERKISKLTNKIVKRKSEKIFGIGLSEDRTKKIQAYIKSCNKKNIEYFSEINTINTFYSSVMESRIRSTVNQIINSAKKNNRFGS